MKITPVILSTFSRSIINETTIIDAIRVYKTPISPMLIEIGVGNSNKPIPNDKVASTIQLPKISPTASSYLFFRKAVKSTDNSGREVPIPKTKKLVINSGTFRKDESETIDWTTI